MALSSHGLRSGLVPDSRPTHLTTPEEYSRSVHLRLAKIGARIKNPAFPDVALKAGGSDNPELQNLGASFLKTSRQTTLLKQSDVYIPVPQQHSNSFASHVESLISGLAAYGIHLGPSSFAASVLPKRGLVFWDFFPARKQEAASLYPTV